MLEMRPDCEKCGGELMDRPSRSKKLQEKNPASSERKFKHA